MGACPEHIYGSWANTKYDRASGIQILAAIQPSVQQITHFIRQPTWVTPPWSAEQHIYTEEEKDSFSSKPGALLALRKQNESALNSHFRLTITDSPAQKYTRDMMTTFMKEKLNNTSLECKLIPSYPFACRRPTPGHEYLDKVASNNVEVVLGGIQEITATGCTSSDGTQRPLDILICATGFDTSYRPRFPIIGPGGKNLQDAWAEVPKGYMALAAPDFPNYFIFVGPNNSIASGPILAMIGNCIDAWCTYPSADIHH